MINSEKLRAIPLIAIAGLIGLFTNVARADRVTYTEHVAPVMFEHCVSCHRPDTAAPMSLRSYLETRPWAKAIREQVFNRAMPPWFADPQHGVFSNDPSLSDEEIQVIIDWVDQGALLGDPKDLPELPVFTNGWQLGEPDYLVSTPEVVIPAEGEDLKVPLRAVLETDGSRWVRAVEIRPENRNGVHHSVVFLDGSHARDQNSDYAVLGVWAVDTPPNIYPPGTGRRIGPSEKIVISQHYHPYGEEGTDITHVGLYFGEGEMGKDLHGIRIGDFELTIPPYANNHEVRGRWKTPADLTIRSFFPHMHYRGKDMVYTATYPDGNSEILLNVPNYRFNWQYFYYLETPKFIPKDTIIDVVGHFDNSAGNPDNPNPQLEISYGENSDDEMMFGIFEYTSDMPIDIGYHDKIETALLQKRHEKRRAEIRMEIAQAQRSQEILIPLIVSVVAGFGFLLLFLYKRRQTNSQRS
ncbi:MAG: hypothetical protein VCD00_15120 [Candidatus Hydrogenedentota bacterium]